MKLFGGWLPYLWIARFELPHEYGSDTCVALTAGWLMGFVFVGFVDGDLAVGRGTWERG